MNIKSQKEVRAKISEELNIDLNTKLILFTAKNFKTSGVKEVLDICSSLNYQDFKIIIAGERNRKTVFTISIAKISKLADKIILLEDYKNIDDLFLSF